jgi:hypothetical protein
LLALLPNASQQHSSRCKQHSSNSLKRCHRWCCYTRRLCCSPAQLSATEAAQTTTSAITGSINPSSSTHSSASVLTPSRHQEHDECDAVLLLEAGAAGEAGGVGWPAGTENLKQNDIQ